MLGSQLESWEGIIFPSKPTPPSSSNVLASSELHLTLLGLILPPPHFAWLDKSYFFILFGLTQYNTERRTKWSNCFEHSVKRSYSDFVVMFNDKEDPKKIKYD